MTKPVISRGKIDQLVEAAKAAQRKAYAPYSGFKVGAALLTSDNQIITGCNVENTTYGLSVCAERVAITKAVSEGYSDFKFLVVSGDSQEPCSPCGACRQFMLEFNPEMQVLMVGKNGHRQMMTVSQLLPRAFLR
jgi:cytidine deaminase